MTVTDATARVVVIAGGRACGHGATVALLVAAFDRLAESAEVTREAFELAAPPLVEAFEAIRFERRNRTPPPFANPAKLARTERRRGRPGR